MHFILPFYEENLRKTMKKEQTLSYTVRAQIEYKKEKIFYIFYGYETMN